MRPLLTAAAAAALLFLTGAVPAVADDGDTADRSFTIEDPRITESSGLAASRLHPGVYWTHNDSDDGPYVYAVDSRTGKTVATITMKGVGEPRDVEAISLGPDGNLYVGDIGDNLDGTWDHVWIYRFPEPKQLADATVRATQFDVTYADGARNAEAMMVHPTTGRVYIASKREGGGGLYEGPEKLTAGGANVFRRVGEVPWVTDGAFSPDGKELVLRSYFSARRYAFEGGRLGEDHAVSAPLQGQSESVTYTADGSAMMFGSEGKNSEVARVEVEGGGSKAPSPSGGGGGTTSGDDGDDGVPSKGTATGGAVAVVVIVLALIAAKRRRG
ncbi:MULTISPECIES: WD40 repeat domain-containing protein [unclassified Streptomyces]|uniref:WD40 repeat domain-containing protein n=1 Tax=Streptomyces sp. gb1(2016) TaxID=1828321 RepID=A0A652KJ14_9ACTN|nr:MULTISPECIES: WD40 repeat domain-containing protein [unclassified Streptomyces]MDX3328932.1 WD40 repeat domain-containing protein [Streptomyces sp. ME02-6979-3A]TXS23642.1 WD40 repeat domain-containing protein [Streptomyces sp. gb1(2016)]WSS70512.1 WD40 repeat domain-containing protein [Streptomyces sp. NBC_01175]